MSRHQLSFLIGFIAIMIGSTAVLRHSTVTAMTPNAIDASSPIPESNDFATKVLGDPWDMNEYSDISQFINESGTRDVVRNPAVTNGVFSGTSGGDASTARNGWFFTLFPGYWQTIHVGKTGSRSPIRSADYSCLFIAMKVASPVGDRFRVYWFADDRMFMGGAPYGISARVPLYPEYGGSAPTPTWKLYKVDLANSSSYGSTWNSRGTWQGLRIDPTMAGNVDFDIDWVRLTDCSSHMTTLSFSPNPNVSSVWLRPVGSSRHIKVADGLNGNSGNYSLDTQGIQPGSYVVGFGSDLTCCISESSQPLIVNRTPIVRFQNPTRYAGVDSAAADGNPWDMSSTEDYLYTRCAEAGLSSGRLWLNTPPSSYQPSDCRGPTPPFSADPQVQLRVKTPIDPSSYRYLTFRLYDDNPWQFVADGSIVRFIWEVQGSAGPGSRCYLVTHDIPVDVGWNVYTIDLWDTFTGSAETAASACDGLPTNWRQSSPVLQARFDPNENITSHDFYNEIDWIRLTKAIAVRQGTPYPIGLDRFYPGDSFDVDLYYTTDPSGDPTQHRVMFFSPPSAPPAGPYQIFLPTIKNGQAADLFDSDLTFEWDTASVAPGEYYICAQLDDGLNGATFCSDATITVTK